MLTQSEVRDASCALYKGIASSRVLRGFYGGLRTMAKWATEDEEPIIVWPNPSSAQGYDLALLSDRPGTNTPEEATVSLSEVESRTVIFVMGPLRMGNLGGGLQLAVERGASNVGVIAVLSHFLAEEWHAISAYATWGIVAESYTNDMYPPNGWIREKVFPFPFLPEPRF